MGTVYRRGRKLWVGFKGPDGRHVYRSSGYVVGQEALAERLVLELEEGVRRGVKGRETSSLPTVAEYLRTWAAGRPHLWNVEKDARRLELHALPTLGHLRLDQVRPVHVRELVARLRRGTMAPRTQRDVYSLVRRLFADAVAEELLEASPAVLHRRDLPRIEDADPAWRSTAVFGKSEIVAVLTDARVPVDRRVVYALASLTGMREGEIAALRWGSLELDRAPLGAIHVTASYTRRNREEKAPKRGTREVPIHPLLAGVLEAWRSGGYAEVYGRPPAAGELVVPVTGTHSGHGGRRTDNSFGKGLGVDLGALGLRDRRFHDLRRSFISLARGDGANRDALRTVTHNPERNVFDQYTTFDWAAKCEAVAALKL